MGFLPSRSSEWHTINRIEEIKAVVAEISRLIADIEAHTLNYNPLNPDESLDSIYQLSKQAQRNLNKQKEILLNEWEAAVKAAKGSDFSGEELLDIETIRNILKTQKMGRRMGNQGGWRRIP